MLLWRDLLENSHTWIKSVVSLCKVAQTCLTALKPTSWVSSIFSHFLPFFILIKDISFSENDFLAYFCYSLEQSLFQSNLLQPINNPDFQIELLIDPPSGYLSLEKPQYENNEPLAVNTSLIQSNGISLGQIKSKSAVRNKRKRHRTKFRQDQLQGMKSVFDTNPNPDAAELQRLSERLVLTKRVLQVWFQNARAKEKRRPSSRKTQCI